MDEDEFDIEDRLAVDEAEDEWLNQLLEDWRDWQREELIQSEYENMSEEYKRESL